MAVGEPAATAPPKLTIEKFADGAISCLKFSGTIDESFEGKKLGATAAGDVLVVDLGNVKKISSFGIREWIDFVTAAHHQVRSLILIECAPKVVDQLNMVANFTGGGRVFSLYAPFRCDYCDSEHRVLLQLDKDYETIKTTKLAERPCPSCKEAMYFDDDGATFFSYVLGQERFELEPAVATFLATKLDYAVGELSRKLRVDKVIEGRTTYLRLAGDLDRTFPRDKLADGLEGITIIDLAAVGRIEPAGAAAWRSFVQMATPLVDQLCLVGVPPSVLEKLCSRDDLGPKTSVVTVSLPYTCAGCGTTTAQLVNVAEHYNVLKFATAPELRCICRAPMQCAASETVMAMLPTLPKPTVDPAIMSSLPMLRERSQQAAIRPSEKRPLGPPPEVAPAPRSSLAVPFLAAALALVLGAVAFVAYRKLAAGDDGGARRVVDRSAPQRPAWIVGEVPSSGACSEQPDHRLSCVGISAEVGRLDDGESEAADAALEALAVAIAARITDPQWRQTIAPLFSATRDAKLATFDRDPASSTARREVREARSAVGRALRATGGGLVPAAPTARYWEQYADDNGKRYLAFAELSIGERELHQLVTGYAARAAAADLGITALDCFPLLGWRIPRVERGAIVVVAGGGLLADAGLVDSALVTSLNGRDIVDAASLLRIVREELASVKARGGTLRFKLHTGADATARDFTVQVATPSGGPPTNRNPPPTPPTPQVGSGGVNVWDRYGGNKRDDPSR